MSMTEGRARRAALQLAASLLYQAAGDREGEQYLRLRWAGASEGDLEQLRLAIETLAGDLRAQARRADPFASGQGGTEE